MEGNKINQSIITGTQDYILSQADALTKIIPLERKVALTSNQAAKTILAIV